MESMLIVAWCIAIHCILWILITPELRNTFVYLYNCIHVKVKT